MSTSPSTKEIKTNTVLPRKRGRPAKKNKIQPTLPVVPVVQTIRKKRGRGRKKYSRVVIQPNKARVKSASITESKPILPSPKPEDVLEEFDEITAQTATNLKAFRLLFGSYEETDEEFQGYYPKEISTIQSKCRRKCTKISKDIVSLECFVNTLLLSTQQKSEPTSPSSFSATADVSSPSSSRVFTCITNPKGNPEEMEKFLGFEDNQSLEGACNKKSQLLFDICEGNRLDLDVEEIEESSVIPISDSQDEDTPRPRRRKGRKSSPEVPSPNSASSELVNNSLNKKDFPTTPERSIAGEITVTPVLHSDVPISVKVRCASPILVNCHPKV